MAVRSIATLSLSFGLVSIPVKVYSATESSAAVRFKLLSRGGARVRRQYVADEREAPLLDEEPDQRGEPTAAQPTDDAIAGAGRQQRREPSPSLSPSPQGGTSPPPIAADARTARTAPARTLQPQAQPEIDLDDRTEDDVDATVAAQPRSGVLAPSQIVKGYEFEKGRFVTFTEAELKALAEASRQTIDIVSFIPQGSVDPVYYDKAYYLAPDRQGTKPYSLLRAAMQESGHCALAKWAWRAKEYVVEIRPAAGGLVLQQLLYADEVRAIDALPIELVEVGAAELQLARRLIAQTADDAYHPERFVDEEKQRILAAVERKIAGRAVVAKPAQPMPSAQVIDLVAALRASLDAIAPERSESGAAGTRAAVATRERKPARRAGKTTGAGDAHPATRARGRQSSR